MRAEIIATGNEILRGRVMDSNSAFLGEELLTMGIETAFRTIVGDNEKDMEEALRRAMDRSDVILITGGLGPTEDDITRKVVAKVARRRLVLNEDALKSVKSKFARLGGGYPSTNDRQALIPGGARLLSNPAGTAPGFFLEEEKTFIAALPGVPGEMEAIFDEGLRQELEDRFGNRVFFRRRILRTTGMGESKVNQAIQEIMKQGNPVVGLTAKETGVDIHILARDSSPDRSQALVEKTEKAIREKLGDVVYGIEGQELEEVVGALLKQRRVTLAVAESCTGGLIGARITNIAGSSEYFDRVAVVYSNIAKIEMLGVPQEKIERHGAVSREVAAAMAQGIRQAAGTTLGLSVTGIAGPGGGTEEKPVGLVYFSLASDEGVKTSKKTFLGDREQVRSRAAQHGLDMVRRHLIG